MPTYKAPVSDTVFLLNDVFNYANYANAPGFSEAPIDIVEAVLSEGAQVRRGGVPAAQPRRRPRGLQAPRRRRGDDAQGLQGGLQGATSRAAGSALAGDRGIRRPGPAAFPGGRCSANIRSRPIIAFAMYPGLTNGAVAALTVHGSDELKADAICRR